MSTIGPTGQNQGNPLEKKPSTSKSENSLIRKTSTSAINAFSTLALSIHAPKLIPKLTEKDFFEFALDEWLKTQPGAHREHIRGICQHCFDTGATSLVLAGYKLTIAPPARLLKLLPQLEDLDLSHNNLTTVDLNTLINLKVLKLQNNQLTTVDLTTLINLKRLALSNNQLTSIDLTTLINLELVNLSYNQLTSIDLSTLIKLEIVELVYNQLTSVDLTTLINLKRLHLSFNQLTTVNLAGLNLRELYLQKNNLTSIILSAAPNLSRFKVTENPHLSNLPLTLGNCPNLTNLDTSETQIPPSTIRSILDSCQAARGSEAASKLNPKIQVWKNSSGLDVDLSFIDNFTEEEKIILYEWLTRLEKSVDFRTNQLELTKVVCNILKNLTSENSSFKELAFSQMAANNEACDDRASMALNELYLSWMVFCENSNLSDKERLEIIAKAGKTLALREAIATQLAGRSDINESVETYLYYEIRLAERLGLLTCIKNMHYPYTAKELDIQNLIDYVGANYLNKAAEIPILEKMMEKDEEASNMIEKISSDYADQIILLTESKPKGVSEDSPEMLEWKIGNNKLMTAREDAIRNIRAAWLEKHL